MLLYVGICVVAAVVVCFVVGVVAVTSGVVVVVGGVVAVIWCRCR